MNRPDPLESGEIYQLALAKMTAVLGRQRALQLITQLVHDKGFELRTAHDLSRFAAALARLGGFEGAVGAMLGVQAAMRGG